MALNLRSPVSLCTLSFLVLVSFACAPTQPPAPTPKRIVDLSPTITEDLPVRRVGHKFLSDFGLKDTTSFEHVITEEPFYLALSYLTLWNHGGPHLDAPNHIIKAATATDQLPLEKFFGRARVLDFRSKPKDDPLLRSDFENREIQPGDIVIAFVGYTPPTNPDELPSYAYLSGEAAEYLANIPIKAFTSDMPGLCSLRRLYELLEEGVTGSQNVLPEHYAFLSRDIPAIEGLVNLESLVDKENVFFVGFPLKIKNGNGAPMRAAALVY